MYHPSLKTSSDIETKFFLEILGIFLRRIIYFFRNLSFDSHNIISFYIHNRNLEGIFEGNFLIFLPSSPIIPLNFFFQQKNHKNYKEHTSTSFVLFFHFLFFKIHQFYEKNYQQFWHSFNNFSNSRIRQTKKSGGRQN